MGHAVDLSVMQSSGNRESCRDLSSPQIPSINPESGSSSTRSASPDSPMSLFDPDHSVVANSNTAPVKANPVTPLIRSSKLQSTDSSDSPAGNLEVKENPTMLPDSSIMQVGAMINTTPTSQLLESSKMQVGQLPKPLISELCVKADPVTSPFNSLKEGFNEFSEPAVDNIPLGAEPRASFAISSKMQTDANSELSDSDCPARADSYISRTDTSKIRRDGDPESLDDNPPTSQRKLRKRKEPVVTTDPVEEAMKPLTDDERRNWKGWVELESDPVSRAVASRHYFLL